MTEVIDPSLNTLEDFEDIIQDSRLNITNWVFIQTDVAGRQALKDIQYNRYPIIKTELHSLFANLNDRQLLDSLNVELAGFEKLMISQKQIMISLVKFEDYGNPFQRLASEQILESEVLPETELLMNRLKNIMTLDAKILQKAHSDVNKSSEDLRLSILVLIIVILFLGLFLAKYMTAIITKPINEISHIVNNIGKGILEKVNRKESQDEIGQMVQSVNNLSERLNTTAGFAKEIGSRNFEMQFEPLSENDTLGKALITMRDNLRISDERLDEAQNIAGLGTWECDMNLHFKWSREMYTIFDKEPFKIEPSYKTFVGAICEEDKNTFLSLMTNCLQSGQPFNIETKITTRKNYIKTVNIQGKRVGAMAKHSEKNESMPGVNKGQIKIVGIIQDITEQKRVEEKIKSNEAHLSKSQHIAHLGSWERIVSSGNKLFWSDEMFRIFEVNPETYENTYENFINSIHPADREKVLSLSKKYVQDHQPLYYEARIITGKGNIKTVYVEGQVVENEKGVLVKTYGITQDVTERKKAEDILRRKNEELTKTNMELDKFVYSVSHDLRAPLSSMLGVIEISEEELEEESERMREWESEKATIAHPLNAISTTQSLMASHLKMLKGSIKKLDGFIKDILDYSRNSRIEVKKEDIHFKEIIDDIVHNLKFMGNNNGEVNIKVDINDNAIVHSDKSRLMMVLNNLISNAIRYKNPTSNEPFVDIKVDTSDTETNIIVRDNGIGISAENQEKIFDMFYRVSDSSVGSGLGLYIVKETVERLNGHIDVESEEGKGSAFTVHLPNS